MINEDYEPMCRWLVEHSLSKGGTFVDVGGNVGQYAVFCGELVGSDGYGLTVEPETNHVKTLRENVSHLKHVFVIQCAISDKPGTYWFYLNPNNLGDHRLWVEEGEHLDRFITPALTLDLLCKNIPSLDFLKVDTQGWEMFVLLGGLRTITKSPDLAMLLEYYPLGLTESGATYENFMSLLYALGFNVYIIDEGCSSIIKLQQGVIIEPSYREVVVNLWCTKGKANGIIDYLKPWNNVRGKEILSGYADVWEFKG